MSRLNLIPNTIKYLTPLLLIGSLLSGCSGSGSTATATVTVLTPGTLELDAATYSATESTAAVTVTVTRTGGSDGDATVDFTTSDGTAVQASDYVTTSGTLSWADGDSTSKTFDVAIVNDTGFEGSEDLTITLSNGTIAQIGTNSTATLTITDDDVGVPGSLQLSATTYSVTEGIAAVTITVTRTGGSDGTASVDYITADGTAAALTHYGSASGTLNWATGDTASKTVDITIADNGVLESSKDFTITLSNAVTATLGADTVATVTITDNDSLPVSGKLSAPGGLLAYNGPTFTDRMIAFFFGKSAIATIADFVSPVPSAPVAVYEVDANGTLLNGGAPISEATTDINGDYVLLAPLDAPSSKYIVRSVGGGSNLDSRITSSTVDVDPVTSATSDLVTTTAADLTKISPAEIAQIQDDVSSLVEDLASADTTSASVIATSLNGAAQANDEIFNVINSASSAGEICGLVTTTATTPIENILIVVRDFGDGIVRAKTKTDVNGAYCLNVPVGDYVIGAFNRTSSTNDATNAASEWYTAAGGATIYLDADKVTVTLTLETVDFVLDPGIQISGTVLGSGGTLNGLAIEGAKISIRDSATNISVAGARVKADGTYRINVAPGKYRVGVINRTQKPYASQYATTALNATKDHNLLYAEVFDLSATPTPGSQVVDFTLLAGRKITGSITEGGAAVAGRRVFIKDAVNKGVNNVFRANKNGQFRIWLKPSTYEVQTYGQTATVDLTTINVTKNFTDSVARQDITIVDGGAVGVSQVKVDLYINSAAGFTFKGRQASNSDGTLTVYSDGIDSFGNPATNHVIVVKVDAARVNGSIVYDSVTQRAGGTLFTMDPTAMAGAAFDIALPVAGVLVVNATDGTDPQANIPLQVRHGGTAGANRFVSTRTRGDGVAMFSLPVFTYDAVVINGTKCLTVDIQSGKTTTIDFDTLTTVCTIGTPL